MSLAAAETRRPRGHDLPPSRRLHKVRRAGLRRRVGELGSAGQAESDAGVEDVTLDGPDRDPELLGDLGVGQPGGKRGDLLLSVAQRGG
jgi:hypothetical protein